jgi:hypothetical protein
MPLQLSVITPLAPLDRASALSTVVSALNRVSHDGTHRDGVRNELEPNGHPLERDRSAAGSGG